MYGGDNLLNSQEELSQIRREMDGWTDAALKVFGRHRGPDNKTHQDQHSMHALNEVSVCVCVGWEEGEAREKKSYFTSLFHLIPQSFYARGNIVYSEFRHTWLLIPSIEPI